MVDDKWKMAFSFFSLQSRNHLTLTPARWPLILPLFSLFYSKLLFSIALL